jgi:1,3-beta-galactosyl-N-acetylhexosamine phosphorylase
MLDDLGGLVSVGGAGTAHTGGEFWRDERVISTVRSFVANGGGFIGVGEPSGHQWQGRTLQLATALGVEKETGFTLGYDKYNWEELPHFITESVNVDEIDFGEGSRGIYALEGTKVLAVRDKEVQFAANEFFGGRCVYIGGLPYSAENANLFMRAVLWSTRKEDMQNIWASSDVYVDVNYYPQTGKYCVSNNSYDVRSCNIYTDGDSFETQLEGGEIQWYER